MLFAMWAPGVAGQNLYAPSTLTTSGWTHVAVTLQGDTGRMYINGVEVSVNPNMTLNPANLGGTSNWLGRSQFGHDPYLNGALDDVRIYPRALSAEEIRDLQQTAWRGVGLDPGRQFWWVMVPAGLEGVYRLDVGAADNGWHISNNPVASPSTQVIDSSAPRASLTRRTNPGAVASYTYEFIVNDLYLTEKDLKTPCGTAANVQRTNRLDSSTGQVILSGLKASCTLTQIPADQSAKACDAAGNCATLNSPAAADIQAAQPQQADALTEQRQPGESGEASADAAVSAMPQAVTAGQILNWRFEDGPGSCLVSDVSPNFINGTLQNMDCINAWSTNTPPVVGGKYSLYTGPAGSTGVLSSLPSALFPSGNSARTLCFWAKSADGVNSGWAEHMVNYGANAADSAAFGGMLFSNSHWFFYGQGAGDMDSLITADTQWNHHCFTYNGTRLEYFLNSGFKAGSDMPLATTANTPLVVGWRVGDLHPTTFFDGWIDEINLYDRVLSQGEINTLAGISSCQINASVTNVADSGPGSLRDVITNACVDGTVTFDPALSGQTIMLSSTLDIVKNLTINASTLAQRIILNGGGTVRPLHVWPGVMASLDSLEVTGGFIAGQEGAGLVNEGSLAVKNSYFHDNSTTWQGGGLANFGVLSVSYTTIAHNSAQFCGGGINNGGWLHLSNSLVDSNLANLCGGGVSGGGTGITIVNTSFFNNRAATDGGGLYKNSAGTMEVYNSSFYSNTSASGAGGAIAVTPDVTLSLKNVAESRSGGGGCMTTSPYVSGSNNIFEDPTNACGLISGFNGNILGVNPLMAPPADNGGPTWSVALLNGSPAIDAGSDAVCLDVQVNSRDQRGIVRPQGAHCDIGSYEYEPAAPPAKVTPGLLFLDLKPVINQVGVPITVTGLVTMPNWLTGLWVNVDSAALISKTIPAGTAQTAPFNVVWTPPGEGVYTLSARASDSISGTVEISTSLYVDVQAPQFSIDTLVYTSTNLTAFSGVTFSGRFTDTTGVISATASLILTNTNPITLTMAFDPAPAGAHTVFGRTLYTTTHWYATWWPETPPDLTSATLFGVVYDLSSPTGFVLPERRLADVILAQTFSEVQVSLDLLSPKPLAISFLTAGQPITFNHTYTNSLLDTQVQIQLTADASGLTAWYGWDENPASSPAGLTMTANPASPLVVDQLFSLAQADGGKAYYFHLVLSDGMGNTWSEDYGPLYHDLPGLPDLASNTYPLGEQGWMRTCSLLGTDQRLPNLALSDTALNSAQSLYLTRSAANLHLVWQGADWQRDGDLFVYLDTHPRAGRSGGI